MPLPFLLLGGLAGLGALGLGKGIKAAVDNSDANDYNRMANDIVSKAKDNLETSRKASNTALETLGNEKLFILDKNISRFITSFEKIKNVQLQDSTGLNELNKFRLDTQSAVELREMSGYASSILGGTAAGALGGVLTGFGAYGAAMTFGAASTGTAIATLGGAAATNATLAFLGGGALAAGGLGVAGGIAVLGGLVAGPALAIMGFITGAKASENLDNAMSNYLESKKMAEELKTAAVLCNGIRRRSYMFYRLLIRLNALFLPLVFRLEGIVATALADNEKALKRKHWLLWIVGKKKRAILQEESKKIDFEKLSSEDKKIIAATASIAKAIKTVLDTPILTEDGKLTDESAQIAEEIRPAIEAYENA